MNRKNTGGQNWPLTSPQENPTVVAGGAARFDLNDVPDRSPTGPLANYIPALILTIFGTMNFAAEAGSPIAWYDIPRLLINSIEVRNAWHGTPLAAVNLTAGNIRLIEFVGNGYDYGHWLWKDQTAWGAFDIFGVHEYDSQIAYAWPADVNGGVRNKEVWQTEMSGVRHWPEEGPSTNIQNGVAVAGWIHSALTVGEASAWLWWWYESYYQNDNEGLAIIQGSSTVAKRYFTMGNYSKFVRPGYVAVDVTGNSNASVLLSAFKGTDGTVVVVAVNKGTAAATVPISITGGTAPAMMTPTVTSATDNLVAKTAVPVTGGSFTATLASKTVTTFVGKP
jgi:O-glycosyl hydrolase